MDSEANKKLIELFYSTPRAQEIYVSLRKQRNVTPMRNCEPLHIDIRQEPEEEVPKLSSKEKQEFDTFSHQEKLETEARFDKEPLCTFDETMMSPTMFSECESRVTEVFKKLEVEQYDSLIQEDQKKRELLKWSLNVVNDEDIIIEGRRSGDPQDINWRTSVICDRISTNVVRSKKGTLYFLLGEIDEKDMIEKNFSIEIINMFRYGFPPDWRNIVAKTVLEQYERERRVKDEVKTAIKPKENGTNRRVDVEEMSPAPSIDDNFMEQSDKEPTRKSDERTRKSDERTRKSDEATRTSDEPTRKSVEPTWKSVEPTRKSVEPTRKSVEPTRKSVEPTRKSIEPTWKSDKRTRKSDKTTRKSDEPTRKSDEPRKKSHSDVQVEASGRQSKRASTKNDSAKRRKTSTRKKETKHSFSRVNHTNNETSEIEVQRSRSGRIICPVLDYWRGQRISMSPGDGELTIIKSNLEEDSKLTVVETGRNSTLLVQNPKETRKKGNSLLQNPKVSSTAVSSTTSSSWTEWSETERTSSEAMKNDKKAKSTNSLRSQSDDATGSDTDAIEHAKPKNAKRRKSERQARNNEQRNASQSEDMSGSETSAVEQRSRTSKGKTLERGTKIATKTRIVQRRNNQTDETSETETSVDHVKQINEKGGSEISRVYPKRTRTQLYPRSSRNTKQHAEAETKPSELRKSQTQPSKNSKVASGKLTARAGTLARKRELRDMLEQQDEGYEDDAFDGTPFKSQKLTTVKVSPVDIAGSADINDEINAMLNKELDAKTPSSRTPMNRLRPAGPLSTAKSDVDLMTPGLLNTVNRNNIDRYVNQLRRQKLHQRKKMVSHTPLTREPSNDATSMMAAGAEYSFNIEKAPEMDDEEPEDYYWSDND